MLGKQLIFVAGLLGILACGACFAPPHYTPPPPPPLQIDLSGIRIIDVEATNASDSRQIDAPQFARQVVHQLDLRHMQTGVKARTHREGESSDATLKITILHEDMVEVPSPNQQEAKRSAIQIVLSATLATRDGRVLWSESNQAHRLNLWYEGTDQKSLRVWIAQPWTADQLGHSLVARMLYAK